MVVKLECASVTDFDPDPAIDRWKWELLQKKTK
jgi:hypothetical protein